MSNYLCILLERKKNCFFSTVSAFSPKKTSLALDFKSRFKHPLLRETVKEKKIISKTIHIRINVS